MEQPACSNDNKPSVLNAKRMDIWQMPHNLLPGANTKLGDKKGPAIFHAEYCTLFSFAAGGFEDGAWLRLHLSLIFQRFMVS